MSRREAFSTKLSGPEAQWVKKQAEEWFLTSSMIVSLCVRAMRALDANGSLRFEPLALRKLLLQEKKRNGDGP